MVQYIEELVHLKWYVIVIAVQGLVILRTLPAFYRETRGLVERFERCEPVDREASQELYERQRVIFTEEGT